VFKQARHEQRKQVTILFANVSIFTALSAALDAEKVSEMMNALWFDVDKIIIDHDGHIDKHIGDAIMAIWGSDIAREEDPERAIRAALTLQSGVQTLVDSHVFAPASS
jgi:class 3 adenylate cyclase